MHEESERSHGNGRLCLRAKAKPFLPQLGRLGQGLPPLFPSQHKCKQYYPSRTWVHQGWRLRQGRVAPGSACPRLARSRTPGPGEEALLWVPPPARCRLSSWVKGCWRASADTDWDPLGARQASPTRHLWQLGFLSHFRDEETEALRHVVTCSR